MVGSKVPAEREKTNTPLFQTTKIEGETFILQLTIDSSKPAFFTDMSTQLTIELL